MIVCICHAVPDSKLREAAAAGLAQHEIVHETRAGTSCGCCVEDVARIVAEHHRCDRTGRERCVGCRRPDHGESPRGIRPERDAA